MEKELMSSLEWTPCTSCGAYETEEYCQVEGFCVTRCRGCGLVYLNPRPSLEAMRKLYPDPSSGTAGDTPGLRISPAIRPRIGFRSQYMSFYEEISGQQQNSQFRVLDFVCRDGSFLEILRERYGWNELYGIDNRPTLVRLATRKGFKVFLGALEEASLPDKFFDLIILRHSLEHFYNPRMALEEIRRTLKNEGLLRIEVPNIDSLSRVVSGKKWAGFYIPWHLSYFSPRTLSNLLTIAGFQVMDMRSFPYPHYLLSPLRFLKGLIPQSKRKAIRRQVSKNLDDSILVGALLAPFSLIATHLGKGDEIMVVAKKAYTNREAEVDDQPGRQTSQV